MPSFIFDISNTELSGSIAFPVRNAGSSFIGVVTDISDNGMYTTMTYTWTSYTNLDPYDGLSFNPYYLSYGSTTSINIRQFGGIALPNMNTVNNASFYNFNGTITATDVPIIPNTELAYCFYNSNCSNFGNIGNWDVSNVTIMNQLFCNAINFNQFIGKWNTMNVTGMIQMFQNATSFNQLIDTSGNCWNVSNVFNLSQMFRNAKNFNQSLNNWNISNVINISQIFQDAINFNQPLNNWNVSNVTDMSQLFFNAINFNQPINNWNVSNVTNMSQLFYNTQIFNQSLNNWITTNVTNMSQLFFNAINFNQPLNNWITTSVIDMNQMFYNAINFNQTISNWDTSFVNNMYQMFYNAKNFNQVSIGNWNFSSISIITDFIANTYYTLNECFIYLTNLSTNPTTNNKSFGIIPGIINNDYESLSSIFISKSITFSNINVYNLILSKSYLTSYTFTISYGSNIIFNGQLVSDYYNNIIYLEDTNNPGINLLLIDYKYNADYLIDIINSTFSQNGTNIINIPYFNTIYPSAIEYNLFINVLSYNDGVSRIYTNNNISNLSRTIITDSLFNISKYTASILKYKGYTILQLKDTGYTASEMKDAGYTALELTNVGYTLYELKIAEYSTLELKLAGYTITQIIDVGYTLNDFIDSTFTKNDYINAGYDLYDLITAGYSVTILISVGYSLSDLINSPFTKGDYTAAGYSVHDLQSAGFTTAMLLSIGYYDFEVCYDINTLNSFFKTTYQRQGINNKNKCSPPIYPLSKQNPGIPNSMRYSQRVNSSNKSTYTYSELVANFGTTIQTTPTNAYRKTSGLGGPTFSY